MPRPRARKRRAAAEDPVFASAEFLALSEAARVVYRELRAVFLDQPLPCLRIPAGPLPPLVAGALAELVRSGWLFEMDERDGSAPMLWACERHDAAVWRRAEGWRVPVTVETRERYRLQVEDGWRVEERLSARGGLAAGEFRRACTLLQESLGADAVDLALLSRGMILLHQSLDDMQSREDDPGLPKPGMPGTLPS